MRLGMRPSPGRSHFVGAGSFIERGAGARTRNEDPGAGNGRFLGALNNSFSSIPANRDMGLALSDKIGLMGRLGCAMWRRRRQKLHHSTLPLQATPRSYSGHTVHEPVSHIDRSASDYGYALCAEHQHLKWYQWVQGRTFRKLTAYITKSGNSKGSHQRKHSTCGAHVN